MGKILTKVKTDKKKLLKIFICIIIVLFYLYTALTSEPQTDDLTYMELELDNFSDAVYYCLHYGNGRFLGNLFGIILSRIYVLQIIIKTVTPCLIIILMNRLCDFKYKVTNIILTIVLILLPSRIFEDVISWTSGFANYIFPVLITLINLYFFKYTDEKKVNRFIFIIFITSITGQLFVEHYTVINIFISFVLIFYLKKEKSRKVKLAYSWFAASVIGGGIMYAIPKIFSSDSIVKNYRSIPSVVEEKGIFVWNVFYLLPSELPEFNLLIVTIGVLILIKYLLKREFEKTSKKNSLNTEKDNCFKFKILLCIGESLRISIFIVVCVLYFEISGYIKWIPLILIIILAIYYEKKNKNFMAMLFMSVICTAPLIFVYRGIAPRCLYIVYICLCTATSFFADDVFDCLANNKLIQEKYTSVMKRFTRPGIQ